MSRPCRSSTPRPVKCPRSTWRSACKAHRRSGSPNRHRPKRAARKRNRNRWRERFRRDRHQPPRRGNEAARRGIDPGGGPGGADRGRRHRRRYPRRRAPPNRPPRRDRRRGPVGPGVGGHLRRGSAVRRLHRTTLPRGRVGGRGGAGHVPAGHGTGRPPRGRETVTAGRVRVAMDDMTGYDLIAIEEATGKPLTEVLGTAAGIFAAAWRARVNNGEPDATYADTLTWRMSDFDMEADTDTGNGDAPKALGGDTGGAPPGEPGPGA